MADTFLKLHIQLVFAVKFRQALITEPIREDVHRFITSLIQTRGHKLLAIYCMPDHIHILIGYDPKQKIPDLVRDIKVESNKFINGQKMTASKFSWQEGYGAFSYSPWDVKKIINYIRRQPEHHKKEAFRSEYMRILQEFEVSYRDEYVFDFFTDE